MCDKGPVQPLPGGAGQGAWGAGWGTLVGAGGLNNYSTGFPNKDARLLVGTVFTTWTIFSEL